MDSTAYRYCTNELHDSLREERWIPLPFAKREMSADTEAYRALAQFIGRLLHDNRLPSCPPAHIHPPGPSAGPVSELVKLVHEAIVRELEQPDTAPAAATRRRGTELFRLLVQAAHPRRATLFAGEDAAASAMGCFLLEACMHCGWCPNGHEPYGKRAAHLYFVRCRKSLGATGRSRTAMAFCYIRGAWLMARKTEGIRDRFPSSEKHDSIEHYRWHDGERTVSCLAFNLIRTDLFTLVTAHDKLLPSSFGSPAYEGNTGARAYVEDAPLKPVAIDEFESIARPKIDGARWSYTCVSDTGHEVRWTVVIQIHKSTIYRIDLLRARKKALTLTRLEHRVPVGRDAEVVSPGRFGSTDGNVTVVEFIANPFGTRYTAIEPPGVALFTAGPHRLPAEHPLEMVIARRCGHGSVTIDKTHLLGIFDG
jgi:hypothetical protein